MRCLTLVCQEGIHQIGCSAFRSYAIECALRPIIAIFVLFSFLAVPPLAAHPDFGLHGSPWGARPPVRPPTRVAHGSPECYPARLRAATRNVRESLLSEPMPHASDSQ